VAAPLTLTQARDALATGDVSSVELTEQVLAEADLRDGALGVFVTRFPEQALAAARAADAARARGVVDRPLLGVPVAVKDIISTDDGDTTGQSLVLDRAWGREQGDAETVARLRAAGAVIVGKTTTMEFALGSPDPTKPFPLPRNPWDPTRWAGGSSSGSGSGVAAGMFFGALGTDTGASVRMPAALCGITGLKPTFGRVPKSGCVPLGYSLDCIGPMARSARDCAELLAVLAGGSAADPTTVDHPVSHYPDSLSGDLAGVRIGVDDLARYSGESPDAAVAPLFAATVEALREAGAEIVEVELPYYREVTAASVVSILAEAAAYHSPDLRTRWTDYFAFTRLGLGLGSFVTGPEYVQAQRVRRLGRRAIAELFAQVDLVLTPTVSQPAPALEAGGDYTATLFAGQALAYHTAYWNALGNPALTMPMGLNADGLPLAAQLVGRPFEESIVLRAADAFQARTEWHLAVPAVQSTEVLAWREGPLPQLPPLTEGATEFVDRTLRQSGIAVPAEELVGLAASLPLVRYNTDLVQAVQEARYELPGFSFPADMAGTGSPGPVSPIASGRA
jgi:aspartyl-tRNA(Asn)/glutamyl-tRNA(Gln) amidotransferase subunit A